jgi:ppGpp synthetase/RelA/SpoT-type nucleotidyltranferase
MTLHGDQLIIRCRELHDIGRQVSETLLAVLHGITRKQKIYVFRDRVKPSKAIWNKVHRNRFEAVRLREQHKNISPNDARALEDLQLKISEAESFGPDDVFDSFGCRYVTLFEEQRLDLIRDLFDALETFKVPATGDVPVKLTNCSIYYAPTSGGAAERAHELFEILRSSEFAPRVISDRKLIKNPIARAGYSSVHFNFELPVIVDFPRGDHPMDGHSGPQLERARFEVQIRDVFEEAWSEAEHYLFYSQKDDFRELTPQEAEKIRDSKELVDDYRAHIDGVRNSMSKVKRQLERTRGPIAPDLSTKSTTTRMDDKSALEVTLNGKVEAEALEILQKAYGLLAAAENAETSMDAAHRYAEAARELEALRDSIKLALKLPVHGRFNRTVKYFVETELANSKINSQLPDDAEPARKLYADLIKEYPSDPTLRVRYGRALLLQQEGPKIDQINQALDLLNDLRSLVEKDDLTGPKHWLPMTAAILRGYAQGELADRQLKNGRTEEARKAWEAAIVDTRDAIAYWRSLPVRLREEEIYKLAAFKANSNIIYYLALLIQAGGGGKPQFDKQAVRDHIREVDRITIRKFQDFYQALDNKMRGLVVADEYEKAVDLAKEIYGIFQTFAAARAGRPVEFHEVGNFLTGQERENLNTAFNVILSQGHRWT